MPSQGSKNIPISGEKRIWFAKWATWVAFLAVATMCLVIVCQRVWGADYWWQLATGRYVREHGIPRIDPFSYTPGDKPWIELRWLYCTALSLIVDHFGLETAVVLKAATILVTFALVTLPGIRQGLQLSSLIVLCLAIQACSHRMFLRPEFVTWLFFAAYFRLLFVWRQTGTRWVWLIPAMQVVWSNSHTLFILGPVVTGAALACDITGRLLRRGRPGAFTKSPHVTDRSVNNALAVRIVHDRLSQIMLLWLATCLACLAQPYGMAGLLFPFQLFKQIQGTVFKDMINEFFSLYSYSFVVPAVRHTTILFVLAALSVLMNLRRLDGFSMLLCGATGYLAVTAIRNVPLFCLVAVFFILDNLRRGPWSGRLFQAAIERRARPWAALLLTGICLHQAWWIGTDRTALRYGGSIQCGLGLAEREYPIRAERFLSEHRLPAPILNTQMEGAYLLALGHRVFIDPRLEVHGETRYARYLAIVQRQDAFEEAIRELDIRTLFIDNHSKLIERARTANWALVYFDEKAAIYVRPDSLGNARPIVTASDFAAQVAEIRAYLPSPTPFDKLHCWERAVGGQPYLHLANLLRVCGQPALAEAFLVDALRANPTLSDAQKGLEQVRGILNRQRSQR